MSPASVDTSKADAFSQRILDSINASCMVLCLSLGNRLGLFDIITPDEPFTSSGLSQKAKMNERYIREWLGGLTCSKVVVYNAETHSYTLPAEHADRVSRKGSENMASFAMYLPLLGSVEEDIMECFKKGGGVPYSRFADFQSVMAEDSGQSVLPALFDTILPMAGEELIKKLESGINVLDCGCGRGKALTKMAEKYPKSHFRGYDLSSSAISWATGNSKHLSNIEFVERDLSDFDETAEECSFDFITTFDAIHDQGKPLNLLKGIHRALKVGGTYLAQDINASSNVGDNVDHPGGPFIYTVSLMHCMTVSLASGGEGLGAAWGTDKAMEYFKLAGFDNVRVETSEHDWQNAFFVMVKE